MGEFKSLGGMFLEQARQFPDDTIVKYKREKGGAFLDLSWDGLRRKALAFAAGLRRLGLREGDRVAILSFNRLEWIVGDLGTMLAGGVDVPIYHTNSAEQCAYIINDCGAKFLLVEDRTQLDKVLSVQSDLKDLHKIVLMEGPPPEGREGILSFESLLDEPAGDSFAREMEKTAAQRNPGDMATIVYTSGTTGPPKGCMISHGNILRVLASIEEMHRIDFRDNLSLQVLPLSHLYPRVSGYYFNLYKNVPFAIAESLEALAGNMMEVRPTYFCCVPRILEKVYAGISGLAEKSPPLKRKIFNWAVRKGRERSRRINAHEPLPWLLHLEFKIGDLLVFRKIRDRLGGRLWFAVSAGAPLSAEVGEFIHSLGIRVIEFYGLTETVGGTMTTFEECRFGTVGKPMPGFEVTLAPDGEILIRGGNFLGYYNKPELTAEVLRDGWCCTGDVGAWDERGFLAITDRKKDLIITSGGKKIGPQILENVLKNIPLVSNAMIYGDRKKFISALITLDRAAAEALARESGVEYGAYEELTQSPWIRDRMQRGVDRINDRLAQYERIKKFVVLDRDFSQDAGEITPTLKVRRKIVTERYGDLLDRLYEED